MALACCAQMAFPSAMEATIEEKTSSPRNPTAKLHGWEFPDDGDHLAASKQGPKSSGLRTCVLE